MPAAPPPPSAPQPSAPHHLLIPFAVCSADAWLPTMKALPPDSTRHLSELLRGMKLLHTDAGDAHTLSPPHERVLALAQGLMTADTPDGLIPWAARDAAEQLQAQGDTSTTAEADAQTAEARAETSETTATPPEPDAPAPDSEEKEEEQ